MPFNALEDVRARRDQRIADRNARRAAQGNAATNPSPATPPATTTPAATGNALSPQQQALNTYYDTPFYQFPLERGIDALNSQYAARGLLQSGAAQKAIVDYASGVAGQGLGDYFQLLGNQQSAGLSAAAAQAGVGGNYASNIGNLGANYAYGVGNANSNFANAGTALSGNYANAVGQGAYNTANALGNAAVANANNNNALWGTVGNALGNFGGMLAYQPYSGGRQPSAAFNQAFAGY